MLLNEERKERFYSIKRRHHGLLETQTFTSIIFVQQHLFSVWICVITYGYIFAT